MKGKILKAIIVILIIMTLTLANFITVGVSLVSYAASVIQEGTETNNKNVMFDAYFKDENGNAVSAISSNVNSTDMKLYMRISVNNEGYFNGTINLENSNFKLSTEELSEGINKIEGNSITLNQINAGKTVEIEVGIEAIKDDTIDSSLLSMVSDITISGTYKDSSEKDIQINATRQVQWILTNPYTENEGLELSSEILTNKVYNIDGTNKRIVQILIESNLTGNGYPIKTTNIELSVPEGVEEVNVLSRGTEATNGKGENEFTTNNWTYSENENKVNILIENTQTNGEISWNKTEKDKIVVTYILDEQTNITNQEISIIDTVVLYDDANTTKEQTVTQTISDEKDGIVTSDIQTSETSMYKGKIYSGEDRTYNTTASIYVNYANTENIIDVELGTATYQTPTGDISANSQYASTTISKSELQRVLGDNGTLSILNIDGSTISQITSSTEADESGNIVVTYPEGVKGIKVQTSQPISTGTINLNNTKVIKSESYDRATIGSIQTLKEIITGSESVITLNETTDSAKLELNRDSLSTMTTNTGVEIKATLLTNSEEYNLYENPTIRIELPSQVESINVNSINLLYADGLQITSANIHDENDAKVIEMQLTGKQTSHTGSTIEGTTIIINADLVLDKKAISSDEVIKMTYTNQASGAQLSEEVSVQIVSPRGMVTVNSINDYGLLVIGEEETQTAKLELGADEVQTEVSIEVINNNDNPVNDVKILGSFPTKGETNTIDLSVGALNISGVDATIYYSENENASEDLNDSSNGWTTEFTDGTLVKKYLIVVNQMDVAQSLVATYSLNIPGNLGYNMTAYEGYKVLYTDSVTNVQSEVSATTIELTTGKGPELTAKLTASIGKTELTNGDTVAQGEIVKYTLELENTGTESATNINVLGAIPEGTKLVDQVDEDIVGIYQELEDTEFNTSIESIAVGETISLEYEVRVQLDTEEQTQLSNEITVIYNDLESTSEKIDLSVEATILSITIDNGLLESGTPFLPGESISYYATISNNSDSEINNVELSWNLPENTSIYYQEIIYNFDTDNEERETLPSESTITLSSIEANGTAVVHLALMLPDSIEGTEQISVSAVVSVGDDQVESNELNLTVYGIENADIKLSANKENEYLVDGDEIEYKIIATNNNEVDLYGLAIVDQISSEFTILEVTVNGSEYSLDEIEDNKVVISKDFESGESVEVVIKAIVNYDETRTETTTVTNKAELLLTSEITITSEEITNILVASSETGSVDHMISGIAWLDEDEDGQRDSEESILNNITVMLVDATTGNIAQNSSGEELTTVTNSRGIYIFTDVPEGQYLVVFEYDTSVYAVTAYHKEGVSEEYNSDAITKTISINGQEGTYGVTDTITMSGEGISNIDIGLITSTIFDLELDKYVSKIVVQNNSGTETYEYSETTLAKVEIAAKQLSSSTVIIEYQIKVTNAGEVAGYVKNIVDYIPTDLKFSSELNTDWYQSGSNLYNTSLANTKLEAGETKILTLTLTKTMTEENTGLFNNTAEIAESYNESGLQDIDSTPGNQVQGEDDMGSADVMISVKTGAMVNYIGLTISIVVLIGIGAYFINRKISKDNDIKVDL